MLDKRFVGFLLLLAFTGGMTACLGETRNVASEGRQRLYADGPLKIAEFQGKQPRHSRFSAYTAARVLYRYRYRSHTQNGQTTVRAESVNVFSVFVRDQSWFSPQADKRLLDHEQGHFDIAEASARRGQLRFDAMLDRKGALSAMGETESVAARRLSSKIEQLMRPVTDEAILVSQEYDRITHHGDYSRLQAEQRRVQKATLNRLAKQLEKSSHPAQHRKRKLDHATAENE